MRGVHPQNPRAHIQHVHPHIHTLRERETSDNPQRKERGGEREREERTGEEEKKRRRDTYANPGSSECRFGIGRRRRARARRRGRTRGRGRGRTRRRGRTRTGRCWAAARSRNHSCEDEVEFILRGGRDGHCTRDGK